jgi:hypothetical protein
MVPRRFGAEMIDHTLSWEVARVGGILAYLLTTLSVVIGILLSLKLRSSRWPRFLTTELHRFVTVLALLFTAVHGIAVWVDPFTGFTPSEVLVPFASHYRPLWLAFGIVVGYLSLAVWASEYVRRWIGYGWWRRFHYLSFAIFALATLHGIGSGSDTRQPWDLGLYAACAGSVLVLTAWRVVLATRSHLRAPAVAGIAVVAAALVAFTVVGPAQAGWNTTANNGNGSGASSAWLASHPTSGAVRPTASFSADLQATLARGVLQASFGGMDPGSLELRIGRGADDLSISFSGGWSCAGLAIDMGDGTISATCSGADGSAVEVTISGLYQTPQGIVGHLSVAV